MPRVGIVGAVATSSCVLIIGASVLETTEARLRKSFGNRPPSRESIPALLDAPGKPWQLTGSESPIERGRALEGELDYCAPLGAVQSPLLFLLFFFFFFFIATRILSHTKRERNWWLGEGTLGRAYGRWSNRYVYGLEVYGIDSGSISLIEWSINLWPR